MIILCLLETLALKIQLMSSAGFQKLYLEDWVFGW